MIDKLEKKGFIVRKPCEKDRRIIYAEISEAGRQKMAEVLPGHYQAIADSIARVDQRRKGQAIALLKKISVATTD